MVLAVSNVEHHYRGIVHGLQQLWQQEGVRGCLKGTKPKAVQRFYGALSLIFIYEQVLRLSLNE